MIRRIICFAICVVISDCELYAQESEPSHVERLDAAVDRIDEFPHGFTASGHPVGCAVALKAIDEPDLLAGETSTD